MAPAPTRQLRPLIYVYEMPPRLTTDLLQRRQDKLFCVPRTYLQRNATQYAAGIYQGYVLEVLMHEWLLSSPHRTHNPSEADWYFVPVYASCAIITHIFETPSSLRIKYRLAKAVAMYVDALAHVRSTWPFWNASGGIDHIWVFGYDEGACFAPAALRPCLLVSHWGNTMSKHNRCTSTYEPDRWDPPNDPWSHLPLGDLRGDHLCYKAQKDIIMPSFKDPKQFVAQDDDEPRRKRTLLFFFSGDLGSPAGAKNAGPHTQANYSMGLRQAAYHVVHAAGSPDMEVIGHLEKDWWHVKYQARLRSSIFCGAFPGDGWSGGISSAIFAGCVPVIIMDGIDMPFENVLNYSAFSVRISEADIGRFPQILRAIPPSRIAALQDGLRRVRSRFTYASIASNEMRISANRSLSATVLAPIINEAKQSEDALDTMMRVLLFRAAHRRRALGA